MPQRTPEEIIAEALEKCQIWLRSGDGLMNGKELAQAALSALKEEGYAVVGWRPTDRDKDLPRDGRWFVAAQKWGDDLHYETGRYNPLRHDEYVPVENDLYRREERLSYEWDNLSNPHLVTAYLDLSSLPLPPLPET